MDQKFERISKLMKEIKDRMRMISDSNRSIKQFNYKIEALLVAFEAYTTQTPHDDESIELRPTHIEEIEKSDDVIVHERREETLDEFMERMGRNLPNNSIIRNNGVKVAGFLYSNREGVGLEEIIRNTGVPKYRCIDILNSMLKAEPPLASKRFNRGFVYSIILL